MAVLSDADRQAIAMEFMQQAHGPLSLLKTDIYPAVAAVLARGALTP